MARKLFLLTGAPGSGKSTWLHQHPEYQALTESWDTEREKYGTHLIDNTGTLHFTLNRADEKHAIETVNKRVEYKMLRGDTIFIDNTNTRWRNMKPFVQLAHTYGYTVYLIDIQGKQTLEDVKAQNNQRTGYKRVPEKKVESHYRNHLATKRNITNIIPNEYRNTVYGYITPEEVDSILTVPVVNLQEHGYERVMIIGDVQGMGAELETLLTRDGKTAAETLDDPTTLFVFAGDLFDRGTNPTRVYDLLGERVHNPNIVVVEGNHEVAVLKALAKPQDAAADSKETVETLLAYGATPNKIRDLITHTTPVFLFTPHEGDKVRVVTHAGIHPALLVNEETTDGYRVLHYSNKLFYTGSGEPSVTKSGYTQYQGYESTLDDVTESLGFVQYFGHREPAHNPGAYKVIRPLEASVEFTGGCLRAAYLRGSGEGFIQVLSSSKKVRKWRPGDGKPKPRKQ